MRTHSKVDIQLAEVDQFIQAKNGLMRYYTSQQTSQSARLIGFTVALFTLLQTVLYSHQEAFRMLTTTKLYPLFFGMWFLITWLIRTIFRYLISAYLAQAAVHIDLAQIDRTRPIHSAIQEAIVRGFIDSNKKAYWIFPVTWFLAIKTSQTLKGWICCLVIATLASSILLWLLW